jgi:hypothetical protein
VSIQPIMTRIAYVSTETTGGSLDVPAPEGMIQARRVDPHGVLLLVGGQQYSVDKRHLAMMGRFFLAAALLLGEDINADWKGDPS